MIFSDRLYALKIPSQMSTNTTREQIYNEIKFCKTLFQVGCGSGVISFDFLLNGGKEAELLDHDEHACMVAGTNAMHNNLKVDIHCSDVQTYLKNNNKKFDAIVVSTAHIKPIDSIGLVEKCLKKNGIFLSILREDVIGRANSIFCMKEIIKICETEILKPIINPEDDMLRFIYKGIKK